ncbi:hypothetical protein SAMN02799624_02044 [Paenibacillus sp. UNC496MF]|uniref:hypothetical protein n=1 Tax=Paenibacillus sp. UNC496MF TaxID=1502753 RepID=UPI0008E88E68|nr:hypothetical protein [Paenibacillus sp. UNC496MF]SFI75765.1 hypothetical protein SAMN02799624_02044 [Paenibacillus sp. UNC496MF]
MTKRNRDEYGEMYNETSNTAAGINTPKDHERFGPIDMVSDAVEAFVDNVQHTFDHADRRDEHGALDDETDAYDHREHVQRQQRHDRHSY